MSKHFSCKDCCKYQTDACDNPKYAESGKHLCPLYVLDIEDCYQKGYLQGRKDAIEEIGDSMTFHQDGLSGYFTISIDEWEKLEEKENE